MEMNLKNALEFGFACLGALTLLFAIFGAILYKLLIANHVKKEHEDAQEEETEPHFIDELLEQ